MPESIVNQKPPADMIDRPTHAPGPWQLALIPPDAHTDPDLLIDEDCVFWIADGGACRRRARTRPDHAAGTRDRRKPTGW
jgi:hypothetical protein